MKSLLISIEGPHVPQELPPDESYQHDMEIDKGRLYFLWLCNIGYLISGVYADDKLTRPSEYLRDCCPLCFGGTNWNKPEEL